MQEINSPLWKSCLSLSLTILWFVSLEAAAQYEDTAVWRTHKVKTVESWVNFLQFENSNDTCLYEVKQVNPLGKLTHLKQNYNCHGWDMIAESTFEYDDLGRLTLISVIQNDNAVSTTKWRYDEFGRVVNEESKYFEPYALVLVTNEYYGPPNEPDSMISIRVTNGDTVVFRSSFEYNNGDQIREDLVDITNDEPVSSHSMQYDNEHRVIRDKFVMMQSYDEDEITQIEYKNGRISRSSSEINKTAAEFWYSQNGLLKQTFYYNKFETLERKVWHKYTFWE